MTEFVGNNMFGGRVVAVAGDSGSCIITDVGDVAGDDDNENGPQAITIRYDDVPRLAAWLASIPQTKH